MKMDGIATALAFFTRLTSFPASVFSAFFVFGRKTPFAAGHVNSYDTNGVELANNFCQFQLHKGQTKNIRFYIIAYNNQFNVPALIGQSAMGYCAGKPTEKSRVF